MQARKDTLEDEQQPSNKDYSPSSYPTQFTNPTFTTQADILKQLNIEDAIGFCSQLTNLYATARMRDGTPVFLYTDVVVTYNYIVKMKQHQKDVEDSIQKKLGTEYAALISHHVAFFDNKKVFRTNPVAVEKLTNAETLEQVLNNDEHALITYPTPTSPQKNSHPHPAHLIYYGKDKQPNTYCYFNPNKPGGQKIGSKNEVIQEMTTDIKQTVANDNRPGMIAYI